jgi:hypothetical protein
MPREESDVMMDAIQYPILLAVCTDPIRVAAGRGLAMVVP